MTNTTKVDMINGSHGSCNSRATLTTKPFVGAKRIMATAYPIVDGVTFKDVAGFSTYCIGDDGDAWTQTRNSSTNRLPRNNGWTRLAVTISRGYRIFRLCKDGAARNRRASHLVLEAFVGPRPKGMQACHFPDRTKTNDAVSNLRWDTIKNNHADKAIHGTQPRGSKVARSKLTESAIPVIRQLAREGWSHQKLATRFGVCRANIYVILKRYTWRHIT